MLCQFSYWVYFYYSEVYDLLAIKQERSLFTMTLFSLPVE